MLLLGSFFLLHVYVRSDGVLPHSRSSQNPKQSRSADGLINQRNTFEGGFSESSLFTTKKGGVESIANFQKATDFLGSKERRREKGASDRGSYRFKKSGIGDSWVIGDDSKSSPNAYYNGRKGCRGKLIIPHTLTDESGKTKYVEVIGPYAFYGCGIYYKLFPARTSSIILSKYIKVIKRGGLGGMDDVTSFRIEEGSCLERIEEEGLSRMSWENNNENDRSGILVLPSTMTNISENGLYINNLIKTIYYCGSTHLSNYSRLVSAIYVVKAPDIKVTSSYSYDYIFGNYTPKKDRSSIAETEEKCKNYGYGVTEYFTTERFEDGLKVTGWVNGEERCPPSIDIPEKLWGVPVIAVSDSAFSGCSESTPISLPRSLERVGREAFADCGANTNAGFVLTVPSDANLSEGSFRGTNVDLVFF